MDGNLSKIDTAVEEEANGLKLTVEQLGQDLRAVKHHLSETGSPPLPKTATQGTEKEASVTRHDQNPTQILNSQKNGPSESPPTCPTARLARPVRLSFAELNSGGSKQSPNSINSMNGIVSIKERARREHFPWIAGRVLQARTAAAEDEHPATVLCLYALGFCSLQQMEWLLKGVRISRALFQWKYASCTRGGTSLHRATGSSEPEWHREEELQQQLSRALADKSKLTSVVQKLNIEQLHAQNVIEGLESRLNAQQETRSTSSISVHVGAQARIKESEERAAAKVKELEDKLAEMKVLVESTMSDNDMLQSELAE